MSRVDIVFDNAGLELFADLAFAELLLSKYGVSIVCFHGKVCVFITKYLFSK